MGTVISLSSYAQTGSGLKPFKVDLSAGYAIPGGSGSKGGVLFVVEPKYALKSQLAVGLRMEAALIARFSGYQANGSASKLEVKAAGSYVATGDYYFSENYSFRPFAGAGAGLFSLASAEVNSNETAGMSTSRKFGGMLRGGFELSHFRLGVEYNIVPNTTFTGYDSQGNSTQLTSKNGYLGIKLGFCIGGGPK